LSPNHRVVLSDYRTSLYLGFDRALCAVKHLINGNEIKTISPEEGVEYFHVLLDEHEIVLSDNLESESLFLGADATSVVGKEAQKNIQELFPTSGVDERTYPSGVTGVDTQVGCQFHGVSSSRRLILWSAMWVRTQVSQASGSTLFMRAVSMRV